jgi:hypothetical protein
MRRRFHVRNGDRRPIVDSAIPSWKNKTGRCVVVRIDGNRAPYQNTHNRILLRISRHCSGFRKRLRGCTFSFLCWAPPEFYSRKAWSTIS